MLLRFWAKLTISTQKTIPYNDNEKLCIGITKNWNYNNFNMLMAPVHFVNCMISSGEGSQSTSFDNSNKTVEQCEWSIDHLQFLIL